MKLAIAIAVAVVVALAVLLGLRLRRRRMPRGGGHALEVGESRSAAVGAGATGAAGEDTLALARRAMDDEDEAGARQAWKTYALFVTRAFESRAPDFDAQGWLARSAGDPHPDVQTLRASLGASLEARARTQGLAGLVAQYRAEVFKEARATPVRLATSREQVLRDPGGRELRLPAGLWDGTLSGTFDNAQNAIRDGWSLRFEFADAAGARWCIEALWDAEALFSELLDARRDGERVWFEEAEASLRGSLGAGAFVGPIATYGLAWDELAPRVGGELLEPVKEQLLLGLVACLPRERAGTQLAFLCYELEDEEREGDEAPPFVTTVELEELLLAESGEDEGPDVELRVRAL